MKKDSKNSSRRSSIRKDTATVRKVLNTSNISKIVKDKDQSTKETISFVKGKTHKSSFVSEGLGSNINTILKPENQFSSQFQTIMHSINSNKNMENFISLDKTLRERVKKKMNSSIHSNSTINTNKNEPIKMKNKHSSKKKYGNLYEHISDNEKMKTIEEINTTYDKRMKLYKQFFTEIQSNISIFKDELVKEFSPRKELMINQKSTSTIFERDSSQNINEAMSKDFIRNNLPHANTTKQNNRNSFLTNESALVRRLSISPENKKYCYSISPLRKNSILSEESQHILKNSEEYSKIRKEKTNIYKGMFGTRSSLSSIHLEKKSSIKSKESTRYIQFGEEQFNPYNNETIIQNKKNVEIEIDDYQTVITESNFDPPEILSTTHKPNYLKKSIESIQKNFEYSNLLLFSNSSSYKKSDVFYYNDSQRILPKKNKINQSHDNAFEMQHFEVEINKKPKESVLDQSV
jgi:hypothetical protein